MDVEKFGEGDGSMDFQISGKILRFPPRDVLATTQKALASLVLDRTLAEHIKKKVRYTSE